MSIRHRVEVSDDLRIAGRSQYSRTFIFTSPCMMTRCRTISGRSPWDDHRIFIRSQLDSFPGPTPGTFLSETYNCSGRPPTLKNAPMSVQLYRPAAGLHGEQTNTSADHWTTAKFWFVTQAEDNMPTIQYIGLALKPIFVSKRYKQSEGSVISFISPSSEGSAGPAQPTCAQRAV